MEEAPPTLPSSVKSLELEGRVFHIVGTAHVSAQSVEDVRRTVALTRPDTIAIELCEPRYNSMVQKKNWQDTNLFRVIREKKTLFLLAQLLLQSFYRRLGKQLEVQPGAEMMQGAACATETGAQLALIDRRIDITLKRVWRHLGFWARLKFIATLLGSILSSEEISAEDIEALKDADQLDSMLEELGKSFPQINTYLLKERDIYLAQKLLRTTGQTVVAVVGAGHVAGMLQHMQESIPIEPLETLPPPSRAAKAMPWILPTLIIALLGWGFYAKGFERGVDSIWIWIGVNFVCTGIGTALACAHPLSILAGALAAPITSLNPAIAAGWVAGLVEAWVRPPKVQDFENLSTALETFRGFYTSPVIRILLVVVLANLGSTIGTVVAIPWIVAH